MPAAPSILLAATIAASPPATQGRPIDTLRALGPALTACFHAPPNSTGSQITVLLSLTASGAVLGKPRITFSKLVGSPDDRRVFAVAVLGSLSACTPVAVTPGLGAAIAGRPLSIRFVGGGPARAI